jgi:hypothetical protein
VNSRKGLLLALVLCLALVVPTFAQAGGTQVRSAGYKQVERASKPLKIRFRTLVRAGSGKPVAVKNFRWQYLHANCKNGKRVTLAGKINRMNVKNRKFHGSKSGRDGGTVRVKAKFFDHNSRVKGTISAKGKFKGKKGCFTKRSFKGSII